MSRLTDLIAQAKGKDAQMGADLEREFKALSSRLPFGLNFERHRPEVVELPLRPIRKGDKVRVLPERGSTKKGDHRLWLVKKIAKDGSRRVAELELLGAAEPQAQTVVLDDLIVVAEFKDTIYPGLVSTGKVQEGGDKPYHTVINGENYHVLKALTYTHRGKVDAIYIDPPYNTGAKDWKYNNDYVESDDLYRHSKWLAMMERRLLVAKELLNPSDSVLIVTIDEKEYLRLGLLLEQSFPEARIQMVSSVINPTGAVRGAAFSRTDEYLFFVSFGPGVLPKVARNWSVDGNAGLSNSLAQPYWRNLRRSGSNSLRTDRPNLYYEIYVDPKTGIPSTVRTNGAELVLPIRPDGQDGYWQVSRDAAEQLIAQGYIRTRRYKDEWVVQYLAAGEQKKHRDGVFVAVSKEPCGALILEGASADMTIATTQWSIPSHSARHHGAALVRSLLPGTDFPFPKSLYAVEDCLRFFVKDKPDAVILDFFAGSGTSAHAVMRLNRQDGGHRQCISITNNEVAASEQDILRKKGLRPGDAEWEQWGICDHITKPRVQAAITGKAPSGEPIKGDYKFTDEFPMAEGFEENAEFFTLTYETPVAVSHHIAFARIAPLLWLRAGSRGQRIDKLPAAGWDVVEAYGLLTQLDRATPFLKALTKAEGLRVAYIVTDDERRFQAMTQRLPQGVEAVRLYESYLTNFAFANGDDA